MPLTSLSPTGKRLVVGGGSAVLGGGGLVLLFKGGAVFFLIFLALWFNLRPNKEPANQLTVVQGTVTNAETGQPIPGMLVAVRSYGTSNPSNADRATDSVRTNAQGTYRLRFRNKPGLYYRVCVDYPKEALFAAPTRYWFADPNDIAYERDLTLGRPNTCDFQPGELHTIAVRVHNRRTGYEFLQMPDGSEVPVTNRDTTVYLSLYALPAAGVTLSYLNHADDDSPAGDTAVALVLQNPAARYPDTVRATLTFGR